MRLALPLLRTSPLQCVVVELEEAAHGLVHELRGGHPYEPVEEKVLQVVLLWQLQVAREDRFVGRAGYILLACEEGVGGIFGCCAEIVLVGLLFGHCRRNILREGCVDQHSH